MPRTGFQTRVARDQRNAEAAAQAALHELSQFRAPFRSANTLHGPTKHDRSRIDYAGQRLAALKAIAAEPFQVMVEVYTEVLDPMFAL